MKLFLAVLFLTINCQAALRPGFSTEVNRWSYAAQTNAGSISARTLASATVWVRDVYSAGIRSKIYRANLFAGDAFAASSSTVMGAVQVPIIRDYGTAVDVTGAANSTWNYVERGSSGGLQTSASSYLDTGVVPSTDFAAATSGHILIHVRTSSNESSLSGCERTGSNDNFLMSNGPYITASVLGGAFVGASYVTYADSGGTGYYLCSRTTSTLITLYKNGSSVATNTTNDGPLRPDVTFLMFACHLGAGTVALQSAKTLGGYSLGLGLDGTESPKYDAAWEKFETTALGR